MEITNRSPIFYDERTLMVISRDGLLRQVRVPFQVRCIYPVGILKQDVLVYVEAVAEHQNVRIMYWVLNGWLPYYHFRIIGD